MNQNEILDLPEFNTGEQDLDPEYYLAGAGLRFVNYIIDIIGYYVVMFVIGIILALGGGAAVLEEGIATVFSLLILALYYIILESATGRTLGKLITGTRVVDAQGNPPSLGVIIGRTFSRFIPFDAFSFLGSRAVGWHDSISGTRVVMNQYFRDKMG